LILEKRLAGNKRFRQKTWHFSDAGNKFDGKTRSAPPIRIKPISPALKRGVIRCKRCGSRVVGNVDNCYFCGKSLKPVYARLWFWIIMVIVAAGAVVFLVNYNLPQENTAPSKPVDPARAVVVGGNEQTAIKQLSIGTAVDVSNLQVKVTDVELGPLASNGSQIVVVTIEFNNQSDAELTLLSTQWMMQLLDGSRVDNYIGTAQDGVTIASNFEAYSLAPGGRFTGRLYFAGANCSEIVFYPSALAYSEDLLVTWKVPELTPLNPADNPE
jgi:hypothetical protein